MLSFWEQESFVKYDHVVLGGGIVGLSTALELKAAEPGKTVAVVERGVFPSGASTKNAGFTCFGSLTEILSDLEKMSEAEVLALVQKRWEGLSLLRQRLGDTTIDYHNHGGYELLRSASELAALNQRERVNNLLRPLFKADVYEESPARINEFGFDQESVKALVYNPFEGQIHTGKMMKALQRLAMAQGIDLLTGAEVERYEETGHSVNVYLGKGPVLKAKKLAICTNAFTTNLLQLHDLAPGRGVVLVTRPVKGLKFKGVFHFDEGFYYFRNYQDRVIFGGGRNLDLAGETTTEFGEPERILSKLRSDLEEVILPGTEFEVEHSWSGIMAFGATKKPVLKKHSDRIFLGVRLGGMGVAIGSVLGKELASLIIESGNN